MKSMLARCGAALVAVCASVVAGAPASSAGGARPGWVPADARVVFFDNFHSPTIDSSKWITCYPWANTGAGCTNSSNNEQEWYKASQVRTGGVLHLVSERSPTPGTDPNGQPKSFPFRSGMIASHGKFDFQYGFVQFEARAPAGQAMWPALWMLPTDETWPPEIDLMEVVGQRPTAVHLSLHPRNGAVASDRFQGPDFTSSFHTFGVDWEPTSVTWYVDGVRRYRRTTGVPATSMYLLADLAVGGSFGGRVTKATPATASFDVRSVEVWQR